MHEDVGLVLKLSLKSGSNIDRYYTLQRIKSFISGIPAEVKCKIYLLHGHMSEKEMTSLYRQKNINAYVTATHGEGYGLPVFDAVCAGLPVVAPNWGGIADYTSGKSGEPLITSVNYTVDNVKEHQAWSGVLEMSAKWCFPEFAHLRTCMRDVYQNTFNEATQNAKELKTYITKTNSVKKINKLYNDAVMSALLNNTKENENEVE